MKELIKEANDLEQAGALVVQPFPAGNIHYIIFVGAAPRGRPGQAQGPAPTKSIHNFVCLD